MGKKYKLVGRTRRILPNQYWGDGGKRTYFRIQALQDIPEYNVKIGDLGGYVTSKRILSQFGSSWIAYGASVYKNVVVADDAYVGDNACIINDFDNSSIQITGKAQILDNVIIIIRGRNTIGCSTVVGDRVIISGHAFLDNAGNISGNSVISGNATVRDGGNVSGDRIVCDDAIIQIGATINDTLISGSVQVGEQASFTGQNFSGAGIFINGGKDAKTKIIPVPDVFDGETHGSTLPKHGNNIEASFPVSISMQYFNEVKAKIESYSADIVKIIKYPLMTDKTNAYTRGMAIALSKAERLKVNDNQAFEDAIVDLEEKFFAAESHATKVASSHLSESELKKVAKARDMFSIASNDASSAHEKKVAFTQGFKQLEGILTIPETTVDAFWVKLGLQELEA